MAATKSEIAAGTVPRTPSRARTAKINDCFEFFGSILIGYSIIILGNKVGRGTRSPALQKEQSRSGTSHIQPQAPKLTSILEISFSPNTSKLSTEHHPICGVTITFNPSSTRGPPSLGGSFSRTSSPAPKMVPERRAETRAGSLTMPPRATLIKIACGCCGIAIASECWVQTQRTRMSARDQIIPPSSSTPSPQSNPSFRSSTDTKQPTHPTSLSPHPNQPSHFSPHPLFSPPQQPSSQTPLPKLPLSVPELRTRRYRKWIR